MIYRSEQARADYAPCLLGNGDVSFATGAEGTWKGDHIFRAGRRRGVTPHRGHQGNLFTFGSLTLECGSSLSRFDHELVTEQGFQRSACVYEDGSTLESLWFLHPEENLFTLKKTYHGPAKILEYHFRYQDDYPHNGLTNAVVTVDNLGASLDFTADGQDVYAGRLSVFTSCPCSVTDTGEEVILAIPTTDGDTVELYICLEDDLFCDSPTFAVTDLRAKALREGTDGLLQECAAHWEDYFAQGYVKTETPTVDSVFQTALYHLKCIATRWSIPVGLSSPMWEGRYFAFDEYYAQLALFGANQHEMARRVTDFRRDVCLPAALARATVKCEPQAHFVWETMEYGHEGAHVGHWLDHIFHDAIVGIGAYDCFDYSGDTAVLEKNYPLIRACARYFTNNAVYRDGDRTYIGKCTDLERLGASKENAFMTTCGAICLLRRCADAAEILGIDEAYRDECRQTAEALLAGLPHDGERYLPYPGATDRSIGVFSAKYPFDVLPADDKKMLNAMYDYLEREMGFGNMYALGQRVAPWYAAWKAVAFARLGRADEVEIALRQAEASAGVFHNMYEINEESVRLRPWFMTAAGVYMTAVQDMLIQSDGKRIDLLPSCEQKNLSFRLAVRGGVTVEATFRDGRPTSVRLIPAEGSTLPLPKVYYRGELVEI